MEIRLETVKVSELVNGFEDRDEDGVIGYGGRLNIRPPYQREFRYNSKQQEAVIHTILNGFPLNIMYWNVCKDGGFFNDNSYIKINEYSSEINSLKASIKANEDSAAMYEKKIQELNTDRATLEKIAREKYGMKKDYEEVYVTDIP